MDSGRYDDKKKVRYSKFATIKLNNKISGTNNQGVGFVDFATEKLVTVLNSKRSYALALSVHPEK